MRGSRVLCLGTSLVPVLLFILPRGDAVPVQGTQSDKRSLPQYESKSRALAIFEDWRYPQAKSTGECGCAGPEIAVLDQVTFVVEAPIQEVWEFYANKITPPDEVAPSWSDGRYTGCNGGRTPQMQYLMYRLPSEAMGMFVLNQRNRTNYIHVSSGRIDKKTYIVMTADEPFGNK
jgi:hypothetical protein